MLEAILIDKTRGFCKGVQQKHRVSSMKNAVAMHFVEAKSHPIFADAPPPKSIETRRFCKVCSRSLLKCTKTNGFLTIGVHRCAKTHEFFHLFHTCLIYLPFKMLTFTVFVICS